ncbi:MAG: beta-galactosidase, partial [Clostridia bacterium]|nr:beta-galactosidase [Clostridia bacterium]
MKRLQCFLFVFVLLFAVFTAPPATLSLAATGHWGDGNNDGTINASDALITLRVAVEKQTVTDDELFLLDVDGNEQLNANDALLILRYAVQKIVRFPVDQGSYLVEDDTQWLSMDMDEIIDTIDGETPPSAISDDYKTHADGGLIYNPLSREMDSAEKTKYNISKKTTGTLTLKDGSVLTYSLPTDVTAYDMIPIDYTLNKGSSVDPLYVEATTFEDQDGSYYDLCLPGNVSVNVQYQGYVAATANGTNRPHLSPYGDNDVTGKQYPQYDADELVASDAVKAAPYLWFKFKITNTGDTILDSDGNGTFCFVPSLTQIGSEQKYDFENDYLRITEDLYPGESTYLYTYFQRPSKPNMLPAGDYEIQLTSIVRNEESDSAWNKKIWGGYSYGAATQTITIGDVAGSSINNKTKNEIYRTGTRNTWLHTYEEFTTSFDSWLEPYSMGKTESATLYVQPAAWSDRVVIKFMQGNGDNMVSATIPLNVETDSLKIKLNPTADNYIVTDEGTKYPAIASQSMCDMRVNIASDPDAAAKQLDELLDMKECGVNLMTTTEAFNAETVYKQSINPSDMQDSNWFMSDMVRKLGLRLEGYTSYPYGSDTATKVASWFTKDPVFTGMEMKDKSLGNPLLAQAEALRGLSQFLRWGNNFYVNGQNKVVFNTEDTRGWMRIDIENRKLLGETSLQNFQNWLKEKYGTIDVLNKTWKLNYTDFSEIDPELYAGEDHGGFSLTLGSSDFAEWSIATNDLDIFRTLERTQNYAAMIDTFKNYGTNKDNPAIPSVDATIGIRTEGGNVTGVVPSNTANSH